MKKILMLCLLFCLFGCSAAPQTETPADTITDLPAKSEPLTNMATVSPIKAGNLDNYLFREDCVYIDTRDPNLFYSEGHVAGFINIPFYGYITDFRYNPDTLFSMEQIRNEDQIIHIGDIGSFSPNYEESEALIRDLFPEDKNIMVISTAGVESVYLLNLLEQLGYDPHRLYNVGSYTNGMGEDIAYMTYEEAKYRVDKIEFYDTKIQYRLDTEKYTLIQR